MRHRSLVHELRRRDARTFTMKLVRWSAANRVLPSTEFESAFASTGDDIRLFAFATDSMHAPAKSAPFSFKVVIHGAEQYQIGRRREQLTPGQVLLTNAGQMYSSTIRDRRTRAISCFLSAGALSSAVALCDEATMDVDVHQVAWRQSTEAGALIRQLDRAVQVIKPDLPLLEELVLEFTVAALGTARGTVDKHALPSLRRQTTREALIGRMLRARDLTHDSHGRVTLHELARVAELSPYHFLRSFRAVFGITPAAYARQLRLEQGLRLLRRGETPRRAATAAAYGSTSAFLRGVRRAR